MHITTNNLTWMGHITLCSYYRLHNMRSAFCCIGAYICLHDIWIIVFVQGLVNQTRLETRWVTRIEQIPVNRGAQKESKLALKFYTTKLAPSFELQFLSLSLVLRSRKSFTIVSVVFLFSCASSFAHHSLLMLIPVKVWTRGDSWERNFTLFLYISNISFWFLILRVWREFRSQKFSRSLGSLL